ncbi:hypothetical protein GCM10011402_28340 [Paracoccus acridae]|uniref:Uncharacterized protein n=1 Tax=Paracoccus acridae TaxID=1795310 RepID=A0ABQ1VJY7_9RHOB|nr:hypothetical protein GCM10011402_28340 [Paracoccus acridae]
MQRKRYLSILDSAGHRASRGDLREGGEEAGGMGSGLCVVQWVVGVPDAAAMRLWQGASRMRPFGNRSFRKLAAGASVSFRFGQEGLEGRRNGTDKAGRT